MFALFAMLAMFAWFASMPRFLARHHCGLTTPILPTLVIGPHCLRQRVLTYSAATLKPVRSEDTPILTKRSKVCLLILEASLVVVARKSRPPSYLGRMDP